MDWKLELVIMPVTDVDRAKKFYADQMGFTVDVDFSSGPSFRIVQLTPRGSACSITLMAKPEAAGSVQALHLVVSDIEAARAELVERGVDVSELFHHGDGGAEVTGPHPERIKFGTYMSFSDPDGNGWLIQEVPAE